MVSKTRRCAHRGLGRVLSFCPPVAIRAQVGISSVGLLLQRWREAPDTFLQHFFDPVLLAKILLSHVVNCEPVGQR